MVTDNRAGMDELTGELKFLEANPLSFGWLSRPSPLSTGGGTGRGTGASKKKDDRGKSTETTVAQVARAHELSLGNLKSVQPPRSVLNATVAEHTVEIESAIGQFVGPVIAGEIDARTGLGLLGEFITGLAKKRYQSQKGFKPLSEERKAQKVRAGKSGDQARINTGQELNSLRFRIGD